MEDKEMKNNARIYIGATVEKLRMDGCELWEIDGIVENILNYITVSEDSIVLTKAEKEKLLCEMYEQGRSDAIADIEKEGKVVMSKEEYHYFVNDSIYWQEQHFEEKSKHIKFIGETLPELLDYKSKETAKKFYDKVNENICVFKLENKSQEYTDGYIQAIADICGRLDETAVELGVNIKE